MTTIEDAWERVNGWAREGMVSDRCLLDLRRRVEALGDD